MSEEQKTYGDDEEMPKAELPTLKAPVNLKMAKRSAGGLIPTTLEELWQLAVLISKSQMAPEKMRDPASIAVAIQMGLEVGMNPMQAVQNIAVINGRPSIWGDIGLALVMSSGTLEDIEETIEDKDGCLTAIFKAKRRGMPHAIERRFDLRDAKVAGLAAKPGPWQQYPKRMLQMRARWWGLKDGWADILKGLSAREEMEYIDVTPVVGDRAGAKSLQEKLTTAKPILGGWVEERAKEDVLPTNLFEMLKMARTRFEELVKDNLESVYMLSEEELEYIKKKWASRTSEPFPVLPAPPEEEQEQEQEAEETAPESTRGPNQERIEYLSQAFELRRELGLDPYAKVLAELGLTSMNDAQGPEDYARVLTALGRALDAKVSD